MNDQSTSKRLSLKTTYKNSFESAINATHRHICANIVPECFIGHFCAVTAAGKYTLSLKQVNKNFAGRKADCSSEWVHYSMTQQL